MAIKNYVMDGVGPSNTIQFFVMDGLDANPIAAPSSGGGSPRRYGISVAMGKETHVGVTTIFSVKI